MIMFLIVILYPLLLLMLIPPNPNQLVSPDEVKVVIRLCTCYFDDLLPGTLLSNLNSTHDPVKILTHQFLVLDPSMEIWP